MIHLENLSTLLSYGDIKEVSIGHALISESLIYGIENTIQKYIKITLIKIERYFKLFVKTNTEDLVEAYLHPQNFAPFLISQR